MPASFSFFFATLLRIKLLDHLAADSPAMLDTLQGYAMLDMLAFTLGFWFSMPCTDVVFIYKVFLI